MLNPNRLRLLTEVAARGSIAAAADALWLTPSAVSQQLAALERETQIELIKRKGRRVQLTPAGHVLVQRSRGVFEALDQAEAALYSTEARPIGRIRIASFPSVVRSVLSPVIGALHAEDAGLIIEIEDLEGEESLDALATGRIDVAIVDELGWTTGARRPDLESIELFRDRLIVVLPTCHPLADHEELSWEELQREAWVMEPSRSLFARTVIAECRRAGFEPLVHGWVRDLSATLALVEAGCGICVLPALAVRDHHVRVTVRTLKPQIERPLVALTRPGYERIPAVRALLEELRSAVPSEGGSRAAGDPP